MFSVMASMAPETETGDGEIAILVADSPETTAPMKTPAPISGIPIRSKAISAC